MQSPWIDQPTAVVKHFRLRGNDGQESNCPEVPKRPVPTTRTTLMHRYQEKLNVTAAAHRLACAFKSASTAPLRTTTQRKAPNNLRHPREGGRRFASAYSPLIHCTRRMQSP